MLSMNDDMLHPGGIVFVYDEENAAEKRQQLGWMSRQPFSEFWKGFDEVRTWLDGSFCRLVCNNTSRCGSDLT